MKTKTHSFYRNVCCSDFDVLVITETWLNTNILNSELFNKNYNVYRRDRESTVHREKKDGGGVLIAVSNKYHSKRIVFEESMVEDIWVAIDLELPGCGNSTQLAICGVYIRPPVSIRTLDDFFDKCNMFLETWESPLCIIGDFNLRKISWSVFNESGRASDITALEQSLIDFINLNNLKQHNLIENESSRILDLVLTDVPFCTVARSQDEISNVHPLHPPLHITFPLVAKEQLNYNDSPKPSFHKADYVSLNAYLAKYNWKDVLEDSVDVNDMLNKFYFFVKEAINKFVPLLKPKKKHYPSWYSRSLIRILAEKENVRKRYKKYGNPRDEFELKLLCERSKRVAHSNYNDYVKRLELRITSDPKQFWSFIKQRRGGTSNYPAVMSDGISSSADGTTICNLFASHFHSVFEVDVPTNCNETSLITDDRVNNSGCFVDLSIDEDDVMKHLKSLDKSKGAGPDGIPPFFIANCATALAAPLTIIYNKSLSTGIFPSVWKAARVVPIHKSGDDTLVSNYRPISILSAFAKVFETLICPYIQSYFKQFITDHQHGFTKCRSTSSNLAAFMETVIESVDSNTQVDVIYTDFSKAFDKVSHSILIKKLAMYGFGGFVLQWIQSYLSNRNFLVVLNGFESENYSISSGVPQGSHLGPILFNIFINNIPKNFRFSTPFLYADDLKLVKTINSLDDISLLQSDLNRLDEWCKVNRLFLNIKKCLFVRFTRKIKEFPSVYQIDGTLLTEADCIRDLGVLIDKKLTFVPHINSLVRKASSMLGFIIRNGKIFRSIQVKKLLYNSFVRSGLEYASVVWRPHYAVHSLHLERIQKRFLWHLSFSAGISKKVVSYEDRLNYFKMSSLSLRREILDMIFLYKIIHSVLDCPPILCRIKLNVPARLPRYPARSFHPPFRRTVLGSNSPIARIVRLYNDHYKQIDIFADSLPCFKKKISNYNTIINK